MAFRVRRSLACRADLEIIFDHLYASHLDLGETSHTAFDRSAARLMAIEDAIDTLGHAPRQGTLWPELSPGLRWVTKDRAIFYFITDDTAQTVDVLAVFFGGQNHTELMLERIKSGR